MIDHKRILLLVRGGLFKSPLRSTMYCSSVRFVVVPKFGSPCFCSKVNRPVSHSLSRELPNPLLTYHLYEKFTVSRPFMERKWEHDS